jgi:2-octaprenyl-6-methoxyphenol hydroxylase
MARTSPDISQTASLDVLIAGAGYVGVAVAVSIKSARPSLSVAGGRRASRCLAT